MYVSISADAVAVSESFDHHATYGETYHGAHHEATTCMSPILLCIYKSMSSLCPRKLPTYRKIAPLSVKYTGRIRVDASAYLTEDILTGAEFSGSGDRGNDDDKWPRGVISIWRSRCRYILRMGLRC